jgi:hypothetical protein
MTTLETLLAGTVNRRQLANALGVCQRSIARYENKANGLPSLTIGGRKLYRLESVKQWLESQERRPNQRRAKAA